MSEFKMVHKPHKMLEWLEGECTEWADGIIKEHFQVEDTDTLSKEQIQEVIAEWELLLDSSSYVSFDLKKIVDKDPDNELK